MKSLYILAALIVVIIMLCTAPAGAAAVSWTYPYSGDWNTASCWSSYPYLPGSGDDVYIGIAGTGIISHSSNFHTIRSLYCDEIFNLTGGQLTISAASQCPIGFLLAGGTITGTGSMTMGGSGYWTAGTISNGGLTNNGLWEISGTGIKALTGTLINNGTINHLGTYDVRDGGVLDNKVGKTYEIKSNTDIMRTAGSGTVINRGMFKKTTTSGTSTITPAFNNNGTVEVQAGALQLWGGGTSSSGDFAASSAALGLFLYSGTYTMTDDCSFSGMGAATLGSGTLYVPTGHDLYNSMGDGLKLAGGTVTGVGGELYNRGKAVWTGSSLVNFGNLRNEWVLEIRGSSSKTFQASQMGNYGTVYHMEPGSLNFSQGSQLHNMGSGEYILYSDAGFLCTDGTGLVVNNGTIQKDFSYGTSRIETEFTNNGCIDVDSGTLALYGGGTFHDCWAEVSHPAQFMINQGQYTLYGEMPVYGTGYANMAGGTVNLDYGSQTTYDLMDGGLLLAGTTFTGQGSVTNYDKADWSLSTISGGAHLINEGTMTISGSTEKLLQSAEFYNSKDIIQTGTGNPRIDNASTLTCWDTSTYEFRADSGISGTGSITNGGLFKKNYSSGTSTIEPVFNNQYGSIGVESGTIKLTGGGTWYDGAAAISGNCGLTLATGNYTLNGIFQASGTGSANLISGNINLAAGAQAKFNLEQGLHLSGAAINGPGGLINNFNCDWSTGTMAGDTRFTNNGTMSLISSGVKTLRASKLYNPQTILHTGTGALDLKESSILDNTGTYEIRANTSLTCTDGGSVINNAGLFKKDWSTGITTVGAGFNNQNTIEVRSGTLRLAGGGEFQDGFAGVLGNTRLEFTGGNFSMLGGFNASGDGFVLLNTNMYLGPGATANFSMGGQGFHFTGGVISGLGAVHNYMNGDWTTGTIAEDGTLINHGTLSLLQGDGKSLRKGRLVTFGTLNHQSDKIDVDERSSIETAQGGTYNLMNDVDITGGGLVKNGSRLVKQSGSGASVIGCNLDNTGTVEVWEGILAIKDDVVQVRDGVVTGGTWQVNDGCTLDMTEESYIYTNRGTIILGYDSEFPQIDSLINNEGTFRLLNGRSFEAQDVFTNSGELEMAGGDFISGKTYNYGTWKGYGIFIGGLSNRGIVEPASGGGSIAFTGSYSQTEAGTLKVNLNGYEDEYYGKIITGGTATLAGNLQITLASGFTPVQGQKFIIIDSRVRSGKFQNIILPTLSSGLTFNPIYTSYGLVLVVGSAMPGLTDVASIADTRQQTLNSYISVPGIVSAAYSDGSFYVQDANRAAGIRVVSADTAPVVGQRIQVAGMLSLDDISLTLSDAQWAAYPEVPAPPIPLFIQQKYLGGVTLGLQDGVWDGIGLNNVGLLVKTSGAVTYVQPYQFAYIDDGSGLTDGNTLGAFGTPVKGVRVIFPPNATISMSTQRAMITGICCRNYIAGRAQRAVLVRSRGDIVTY